MLPIPTFLLQMRERETFLYHKEMELQQNEVEMLESYQVHQPQRPKGKGYQNDRITGKHVRREPDHIQPAVGGLPMSRTRSDGMVVDASGGENYSDPVKEQDMFDHRKIAKSLVRVVLNGREVLWELRWFIHVNVS